MNMIETISRNQLTTTSIAKPVAKFNVVGKGIKSVRQDTYVYDNNKQLSMSIYSLSSLKSVSKPTVPHTKSNNLSELSDIPESQAIQSVNSTNDTIKYYNVIINRCAKKAGVSVSSNGSPSINGGYEAQAYNNELNRIHNAFWCQTGGWSNLDGDGSSECMRTAMATMASINSGVTVTPNNTGSGASSITINGELINRVNETVYQSNNVKNGLTYYDLNSETKLIAAINNELMNDRSVIVKTTVAGQHWVTVTGTKNGKPAASFNDFIGVDPWYNGGNTHNPSSGSGSGSNRSDFSGVITLSNVSGQNLHSSYCMMTYK